jgi:hypothetical protein
MKAFEPFEKISRWSRPIVVTEKLDGTNALIDIDAETGLVLVGSRTRWITPEDDNYGFARWAKEREDELRQDLGPGRHFGEWWGSGIQRRYGLTGGDKRFSLFNTARWQGATPRHCSTVPVLYQGPCDEGAILACLDRLRTTGSVAAPGFMKPEGVVIYHAASRTLFKKTIEKDEEPKGVAQMVVS